MSNPYSSYLNSPISMATNSSRFETRKNRRDHHYLASGTPETPSPLALDDPPRPTTRWGPPVIRWFINPMNTIVIATINHSDIGVMFTNLAIVAGGPTGPSPTSSSPMALSQSSSSIISAAFRKASAAAPRPCGENFRTSRAERGFAAKRALTSSSSLGEGADFYHVVIDICHQKKWWWLDGDWMVIGWWLDGDAMIIQYWFHGDCIVNSNQKLDLRAIWWWFNCDFMAVWWFNGIWYI